MCAISRTLSNAEEALEKIAKQTFDCILTDLWMPGMNGIEFVQTFREEYPSSLTKIALITADAESKDHFDYSVFDAVLTKPISSLAILNFLEKSIK